MANDSLIGEQVNQDSIMISYDDLRIVNSKLVELEYEKEINSNLHKVVKNDSIAINNYKKINDNLNKSVKKEQVKKNIYLGTTIVATLVAIFVGIFK